MATKKVSDFPNGVTPLPIFYWYLYINGWTTDVFKILPVHVTSSGNTFLGLIRYTQTEGVFFNQGDSIALPCPPYCNEGVPITADFNLIPINENSPVAYDVVEVRTELSSSGSEYYQLVRVHYNGQDRLGFMSVNQNPLGGYLPLPLAANDKIVLPVLIVF